MLLARPVGALSAPPKDATSGYQDAAARREIAAIEKQTGGRVGVALTSRSGETDFSWRGGERFAMCSTFKAPLAFALFDAVEKRDLDLDARFALKKSDLVPYAPYVEKRLAEDQPVSFMQLAKAAVAISDNAAANLILKAIGGPAGFTRFVRNHGDEITRLDRIEPFLNENKPDDPRDTTSPEAFASLMHSLMIARPKHKHSTTVYDWMANSPTGRNRIRLGLPYGWPVGTKTGTAAGGIAVNDVAIFWPSFSGYGGDEPRILSVYWDRPTVSRVETELAMARIAKIAAWLVPREG
ncbi:beta-lactamase class A [Parasphingorhabdus marina DSM 22363]|uniref:beta-lactamase n=2 Tax=Parasphingorhabdus marina TaxID=394732 RepID=A0A1N6F9T3_9SPHN|nr:beta-lactamase class A [Parasphingorhabdus marina DSM 22363]